jgi:hypothetical protein
MRRRAISSDQIADQEDGEQILPSFTISPRYSHDSGECFSKFFWIQLYTLQIILTLELFRGLMGGVNAANQIVSNGRVRVNPIDGIASLVALAITYFFIYASHTSMICEEDVMLIDVGFINDDRRLDGSSWHITKSFIIMYSYLLVLFSVLTAIDFGVAMHPERFLPDTAALFPILYVGGFLFLAIKTFNTRTNLVLVVIWILCSCRVVVVAVVIIPCLLIPLMRMLGIANKPPESPPPPRKGWVRFINSVIWFWFFAIALSLLSFVVWLIHQYIISSFFGLSKFGVNEQRLSGFRSCMLSFYNFIYYRHVFLLSNEDPVVGFKDDDRRLDEESKRQYAAVRRSSEYIIKSFVMMHSYLLVLFTALTAVDHCLAMYSDRILPVTAALFPVVYVGGFILHASKTFNTRTYLALCAICWCQILSVLNTSNACHECLLIFLVFSLYYLLWSPRVPHRSGNFGSLCAAICAVLVATIMIILWFLHAKMEEIRSNLHLSSEDMQGLDGFMNLLRDSDFLTNTLKDSKDIFSNFSANRN